uniref:Uncharacterized protein n=1 Tax=Arundo donax TaxID=35708 RepID=A0A0A9BJW4_ARUDO
MRNWHMQRVTSLREKSSERVASVLSTKEHFRA